MQFNEKQKFEREINEVKKIFAYRDMHEKRAKGILFIIFTEYKNVSPATTKI